MKPAKRNIGGTLAVPEEMKAWSAALATEVSGWPLASARVFFGFTALYRRDKMFAALPRTRVVASPNAFIFKLTSPSRVLLGRVEADSRVAPFQNDKGLWFTFELSSGSDLHCALDWLGQAYEAAASRKKTK